MTRFLLLVYIHYSFLFSNMQLIVILFSAHSLHPFCSQPTQLHLALYIIYIYLVWKFKEWNCERVLLHFINKYWNHLGALSIQLYDLKVLCEYCNIKYHFSLVSFTHYLRQVTVWHWNCQTFAAKVQNCKVVNYGWFILI